MLLDRARHGCIFALVERVVAAHQTLQFRKLADHVGHQVRFAERRGALGLFGIAPGDGCDPGGKLAQTFDTLRLAAELLMEDDAAKLGKARFQRGLAILIPEELRVRQSGSNDALVAVDDRFATVFRDQIRDQQEPVRQPIRLTGLQREALLMAPHGSCQDFAGHIEKRLIERSHQYDGLFGKTGILHGERRVVH